MNNRVFALSRFENSYGYGFLLSEWENDGTFIKADTIQNTGTIQLLHSIGAVVNDNGYVLVSVQATSPVTFHQNVSVNCPSSQSNAVFALYHNPEFTQPFVPDDSVGLSDYLGKRESDIYIYPNPTSGEAVVCGYMYGYTGIELYDLQGRKLADLVETICTSSLQPAPSSSLPVFDLSPYPAGTYLVKINFERGVSVVRKVVKS
ncbi:MAG: T9SS type A sorting domain-containing protein [Bacteroidales bacterium]|nr:T9SS type A sorting domain-containing protein [Bacteroidales bacterium]